MGPKSSLLNATISANAACGPTEFAETETKLEHTLTVRAFDHENRPLPVAGGCSRFIIRADDGIMDFDQIELGDRVNMTLTQSTAVAMALHGDTGKTAVPGADARRAVGQRPAAFPGQALSAIVTFDDHGPSSNDATLPTPDGRLLIANVPVELRCFAAARQTGQRIVVESIKATAITIEPAS